MPYKALLKKTFETCEVKRVAIVDDAFDPLDLGKLKPEQYTTLRTRIDDLIEEEAELGEGDERMPIADLVHTLEKAIGQEYKDFRRSLNDPKNAMRLWQVFEEAGEQSALRALLAPLFGGLATERRDKLRPLRALRELIETSTGAEVQEFDSGTTADQVVGFDMVFLDFYLSDEVPNRPDDKLTKKMKTDAKARSVKFLADLVESRSDELPLVMLISSIATASDLPEFRDKAKMFASKMFFLPKNYAVTDPARAQHTILSLAKHRPHAEALVGLLRMWREAVTAASDDLMLSLRQLDLTDYSYMQHYRLASEKTPLADYLVWLFSGQLTDLVENRLREAKAGELVKKIELPEPVPGRIAPSHGTTRIYSALTTSRIPIADGAFQPRAWAGDIYLDTKRYNEIYGKQLKEHRRQKSMPEVLTVVTPACDLVPGRSSDGKLRTVTMVGGRLVPLDDATHPSLHLIMLNDQPFMIEWNTKWPVTMSLDAMGPGSSMAGRYQWVGRLRELYHAELQHRLLADIGRVGLPVAPTMSTNVPVRILAKTGAPNDPFELVFERDKEDGAAWTFAGEKGKRSFCLREDVAWEVRNWTIAKQGGHVRSMDALRKKVDEPMFVPDLQMPVHFSDGKTDARTAGSKLLYRRSKSPSEETGVGEQANFLIAVGQG